MFIFRCGGCGFQAAKPVQIRRHQVSSRCSGINKIGIELDGSSRRFQKIPLRDRISAEIVDKIIGDGDRSFIDMFKTYLVDILGKNAVSEWQDIWIERARSAKNTTPSTVCFFDKNGRFTRIHRRRQIVCKMNELYREFKEVIRALSGHISKSTNFRLLSTLISKLARSEPLHFDYRSSVAIFRSCFGVRPHRSSEFLTAWKCTGCGFSSFDRGNAFAHANKMMHRIESIESRFREVSIEEIECAEIDRSSPAPHSISDHYNRAMYAIREGTLNWITHDVVSSFTEYIKRFLAGEACPDRFRCIGRHDRHIHVFEHSWNKYRSWIVTDVAGVLELAFNNFRAFIVDLETRCSEIDCPMSRQSIEDLGVELFTYNLQKNALHLHDLLFRSI